MMKIDTKNPYAMKPKKVDNELGLYNADYENFMHYAEQTISECESIQEWKGAIKGFLEIYNSVCYLSEDVKLDQYNIKITDERLFNHVSWMWNEYWSAYV